MRQRLKAGFTLIEIMIVLAISALVMIVLMAFFLHNLQRSVQESAYGQVMEQVQSTLDQVATDVRLSSNADSTNRNADPNSPSGSTNQYSWASNSSTLVLVMAAKTAAHQVIFSDAANYISAKNNVVYFVSGGTLYKRTIADQLASGNAMKTSCPSALATATCTADKAMINNVSAFSISYIDASNNTVTPANARAIQISLTAQKTVYGTAQKASYTTRMVFRND